MTKPLALCYHENLLLGNQLVNRLEDLGYRVQLADGGKSLVSLANEEKPFVVIADLACRGLDVLGQISALRQDPSTQHIPIVAFAPQSRPSLRAAANSAGATLVVVETGLLQQLPELLDQAIEVQ